MYRSTGVPGTWGAPGVALSVRSCSRGQQLGRDPDAVADHDLLLVEEHALAAAAGAEVDHHVHVLLGVVVHALILELLDAGLGFRALVVADEGVGVAFSDGDVQGAADLLHEQGVLEDALDVGVHAQGDLTQTMGALVGLDDRGELVHALIGLVLHDLAVHEAQVDALDVGAGEVDGQVDEDLAFDRVGVGAGEDLAVDPVLLAGAHVALALSDAHGEGELATIRMLGDDGDLGGLVEERLEGLLGFDQDVGVHGGCGDQEVGVLLKIHAFHVGEALGREQGQSPGLDLEDVAEPLVGGHDRGSPLGRESGVERGVFRAQDFDVLVGPLPALDHVLRGFFEGLEGQDASGGAGPDAGALQVGRAEVDVRDAAGFENPVLKGAHQIPAAVFAADHDDLAGLDASDAVVDDDVGPGVEGFGADGGLHGDRPPLDVSPLKETGG